MATENLACEVLSTGDEVLTGQIADTNAAFLADRMGALGFEVTRHTTVGDDRAALADAFRTLGARADVVVCTGGLGPTIDDLTAEIVAEVLGCGFRLDQIALDRMEAMWRARGREMPDNNKKQAMLPELAEVLENPIGTAPGFTAKIGRAQFFFMPGVPREMEKMFVEQVVPRLDRLRGEPATFEVRVLRSFGLSESAVDRMLSDFDVAHPEVKLGFRAHFPEIQVKLTAKGRDGGHVKAILDAAANVVRERLGARLYSEGASMEAVIGDLLRARRESVSTAESCTGGLLAKMITDVAGASAYFHRGYVTYANEAKSDLLGVPEAIFIEHGAVSEACVIAMAEGARTRSKSTYAIAITGIAGPDGGTAEKPVGTVWIAIATPSATHARLVSWPRGRDMVRAFAAFSALDLLRRVLLDLPIDVHDSSKRLA